MKLKNFLIFFCILNLCIICTHNTNHSLINNNDYIEKVYASTDISNNITFTLGDNHYATIQTYVALDNTTITIPHTISKDGESYLVTNLSKNIFDAYKNTLTTLNIPDHINIPYKFFENFPNLETINFITPTTLEDTPQKQYNLIEETKIEKDAFNNCQKLEHINFTNSNKLKISVDAFNGTPWFTQWDNPYVISPNNHPEEKYLCVNGILLNFTATENITCLHIPEEVKYIKNNSFNTNDIANITQIISMDEIITIDANIFKNTLWYSNWSNNISQNTQFLTIHNTKSQKDFLYATKTIETPELNIADNIYAIGSNVFEENNTLETVHLNNNIKYINNRAFSSCPNLKTINIPKNIIRIDAHAFSYCDKLGTEDGYLELPNTSELSQELASTSNNNIYISSNAFVCSNNNIKNIRTANGENITLNYFMITTSETKFFDEVYGSKYTLVNATIADNFILYMASNLAQTECVSNLIDNYLLEFIKETNLKNTNLTKSEKLSLFANYLNNQITYAWINIDECKYTQIQQSALSSIVYTYCVCAGYTQLVDHFCDLVDIKSLPVRSATHAWNVVYIDDNTSNYNKWYVYDQTATWYYFLTDLNCRPYINEETNEIAFNWSLWDYRNTCATDKFNIYCAEGIITETYMGYNGDSAFKNSNNSIDEDNRYPSYKIEIPNKDFIKNVELYKKTNHNTDILIAEINTVKDSYNNNDNLCFKFIDATQDNYFIRFTDIYGITKDIPIKVEDLNSTNTLIQTTLSPYLISKNIIKHKLNNQYMYSMTIDITPYFNYTINLNSNDTTNYNFEIVTKETHSNLEEPFINTNAYIGNYANDIQINKTTNQISITIKPKISYSTLLNTEYLLNIKDANNTNIYTNISLNQANTYYKKFKTNINNNYTIPFELCVIPNNTGATLNLFNYIDGDVTLNNEVTSEDGLAVLMYVVNKYNIIQTGATSLFDIGHGNITVNGDISSNNTINVHASSGNFNGKITARLIQTWGNVNAQTETTMEELISESPFTDNQMTSLFFENTPYIDSEYTNDTYAAVNNGERNNININNPLYADTINLQNNVNISNNMKANGNIDISGSVQNDTRCVIYSANGDINLDSTNFSFSGLIYAPNGTVTITGKNINITGTIIAKEVIIDGETVNFNTNNNFLNYTNLSDKYLDLTNTYFSDLQLFIADMDEDNKVTASDANCILNKVVNKNN